MEENKDKRYFRTAHPDRYSILKYNAKENRKIMTEAESLIWQYLRRSALGTKFRRQHPIGDYIADFISIQSHLIIEIDGKYHNNAEQVEADRIRTNQLSVLGYEVLRFTNDDIFNNLESVLKVITNKIIPLK